MGTGYVTGLGNLLNLNASGYTGLGFVFTGYFDAFQAEFAGNDWLTGGTTLTVASYIAVGQSTDTQAASLAILAHSVLAETAGGQGIGIGVRSTGALGISGQSALLNMTSNEILVGDGGNGRLSLSNDAAVVGGYLDVGDQSGTGTVLVGGGSVFRLSGGNYGGLAAVGSNGGSALLLVNGFSVFTCSSLLVGAYTPNGFTDTADVALAQLSVFGTASVTSQSQINLSFGALFTVESLYDSGTINETGQNTQADVSGSLDVGGTYLLGSQAFLSIDTQTSGGGLTISGGPSTPALLTVDDATLYGGAAVVGDALPIGNPTGAPQAGTLVVQDSGVATLTSLSLNSGVVTAPSVITVTGPYSRLSIGGGAYVGNQGAGDINVTAGGNLTIGANSMLASLDVIHGSFTAGAGAHVTTAGTLAIDAASKFSASGATLNLAGLTISGVASVSNGTTLLSDAAVSGNFALYVASGSGQSSQLSVSGTNTVVSTVGVADIASGTVTVSSGATFSCQDTTAEPFGLILDSPNAGAPASVLDVAGAGSRLEVTGEVISYYSPGETLSIMSGAVAGITGDVIDAKLDLVVNGAGSQLNVAGALSPISSDPSGGTTLSVTGGAVAYLGAGSHVVKLTLAGVLNATGNLQLDSASGYGTITTTGTLYGGGIIQASGGGTLVLSGASLGGVLATGGGSTLVLSGAGADVSAMDFLGGGGTLVEAATAKLSGISGFGVGDFVDLTAVTAASDSFANGTLTLLNGQNAAVGSLVFGSGYSAGSFTLSGDGHGGTKIGFN